MSAKSVHFKGNDRQGIVADPCSKCENYGKFVAGMCFEGSCHSDGKGSYTKFKPRTEDSPKDILTKLEEQQKPQLKINKGGEQ